MLSPIPQCASRFLWVFFLAVFVFGLFRFVFSEEMKGGGEVSEKDTLERREGKNHGRKNGVDGQGWDSKRPMGTRWKLQGSRALLGYMRQGPEL